MNINLKEKTNIKGYIGFYISLISLVVIFIPYFGIIFWIIGIVYSISGLFYSPKIPAIAGLIISFAWIAFLLLKLSHSLNLW